MTLDEYIKKIEMDKHDITLVVRGVAKDPIVYMNYPEAATQDYFNECGEANSRYIELADKIMAPFNHKWRDPKSSEQEQKEHLEAQIKAVSHDIVPLIRDIVQYYSKCLESRYYFADNKEGRKARDKMTSSKDMVDELCADLEKLGIYDSMPKDNYQEANLLLLLQDVFDDINAEVSYLNEYKISDISILTDIKKLKNHVLLNIKENIETHAFGTSAFQSKFIWEKKVQIDVLEREDLICIQIKNNGTPFKGKLEHIFEYGYCFGEKKHSGLGMNSAKNNIQDLGGDLSFSIAKDGVFSVIHTITLPRK